MGRISNPNYQGGPTTRPRPIYMTSILQIIGEYLEERNDGIDVRFTPASRPKLLAWLIEPSQNGGTMSRVQVYQIDDVELVIDAMIAAGLGRHFEQDKTVYCMLSY